MDEQDRSHLEEQLQIHRRRLRRLENQAAMYGPRTSPEVLIEIDDIQSRILQIEAQLAQKARLTQKISHSSKIWIILSVGLGVVVIAIIAFIIGRQQFTGLFHSGSESPTIGGGQNVSLPPASTTPTQAVQEYYTAINNRQFDVAWSMLTPSYQQLHNPDGYSTYAEYWQKQGGVSIDNVQSSGISGSRNLVEVQITYPDQNDSTTFRFALIFDQQQQKWLFDQYCEIGGQPRCPVVGIE